MPTSRVQLTSAWTDLGPALLDVEVVVGGVSVWADTSPPATGVLGVGMAVDGVRYLRGFGTTGERVYARAVDQSATVAVSTVPSASGGGGGAATVADGADVTQGAKADSPATNSTSSWSIVALLKGLYARLAGTLTVDGSAVTQPVSVTALPLPTGAATGAKQDTINTALGAPADTAYGGTGSGGLVALLKGLYNAMIAATPAGEAHVGSVAGEGQVISGTFTRPADTAVYAVGDVVANSTVAGSVVPIQLAVSRANDKLAIIPRARVKTNDTAFAGATVWLHVFKSAPTFSVGDNGVFSGGCTESNYIGYFPITLDRHFSDQEKGFGVPAVGPYFTCEPDAGTKNVYGIIETRTAVTPGSGKTWTVTLEVAGQN